MPSTGGSRILDGFQPAYDASAVRRLREAGAIVVGKTNLDEFGMGSTTESSGFQMFFTELTKEASDIAGYFSTRVQHLLNLLVPSGLQRYIWRVRQCFIDDQQIMVQQGRLLSNYVTMNAIAIRKILKKYDKRRFQSKMQTEHLESLQSPWLIELGAFHLNCDSSDIDEPAGFFKNGFFKNFSCDLTATQPVTTMAISETMKYDYSLTCPICLDTIFNPYALSCGHLFYKGCSCGAASVYIFQGVRSAPPEAKCPVCREVGVFAHAVHMNELDLLIKTSASASWEGLWEDKNELSRLGWDLQA
ncbi:hypothetical protein ZWY2020_052165 [Hordeum vulgare]|nr:hypothetical protein ZWY2020_052165 [Hordeum vulgare]